MSKRFLVKGQEDLRGLERQIVELEVDFDSSRQSSYATVGNITQHLRERHAKATNLYSAIQMFLNKVADKHQPAQKLHDATVTALRRRSVDQMMTDLTVADSVPPVARDRRVTLGGRAAQLRAKSIIINDRLNIAQTLDGTSVRLPGGAPEHNVNQFFHNCEEFITNCTADNLPKLSVEASLHHATTARSYESYCRATRNQKTNHASEQVKTAREILENAKDLCALKFQNADALRNAVEESIKLLGREWYEDVTKEEIAAVKKAMLSSRDSFATHSGHWYNCANGHPVSSFEYLFYISN